MQQKSGVDCSYYHEGLFRSWIALGMLSALYVLALVDRQILVLLIAPIKEHFQLSDVQIGLLIGTAFAIVYSLLGLPAGRFADRGNRKRLVIAGVLIWCFSTIASGFASTYMALIILRLGLAAGEAVLTPAAHSMIGDLFPPQKRTLAASLFSSAGFVGSPLAFSGGALLILTIESANQTGILASFDVWQLVLFAVGAPGLVLAGMFAILVNEPARMSKAQQLELAATKSVKDQILAHKKLYAGLLLSASLAAGCSYSVYNWLTESLIRDFGWNAVEAGAVFGPLSLVAAVSGVLSAPWLSQRLRARGRSDSVVLVSLMLALICAVALGLGPLQTSPNLRLALIGIGLFATLGSSMNIVVSMQEVAPSRMRATFVAILFIGISLFGGGIVPVLVPMVADLVGGGLSPALALVCALLSALSALLLFWIRADFEREATAGFPDIGECNPLAPAA
ncbi:MAG: MFS transporter [Pontixanthobacter sp.]